MNYTGSKVLICRFPPTLLMYCYQMNMWQQHKTVSVNSKDVVKPMDPCRCIWKCTKLADGFQNNSVKFH